MDRFAPITRLILVALVALAFASLIAAAVVEYVRTGNSTSLLREPVTTTTLALLVLVMHHYFSKNGDKKDEDDKMN